MNKNVTMNLNAENDHVDIKFPQINLCFPLLIICCLLAHLNKPLCFFTIAKKINDMYNHPCTTQGAEKTMFYSARLGAHDISLYTSGVNFFATLCQHCLTQSFVGFPLQSL